MIEQQGAGSTEGSSENRKNMFKKRNVSDDMRGVIEQYR